MYTQATSRNLQPTMAKKKKRTNQTPEILNRKAKHDYHILETIECGIVLVGSEVKSIREGKVSIGEGYARTSEDGKRLELFGVHINEYSPAAHHQHKAVRGRTLLAHKREIRKLHHKTREKGVTLIPLKMYFRNGWVKVLLGVATGKGKADKRQTIAKRDTQREIRRAMSHRR